MTSGMLCPVLGSLVQERHELNEASSPQGLKMIKGLEIFYIREGCGSCDGSAWRSRARGNLSLYVNTWWRSEQDGAKLFLVIGQVTGQ